MVVYAGEPYTPHEYHHFDRIFSIKWENGLSFFPPFYLAQWFNMLLNPHQLPKETIWIVWNYFGVPPYICSVDTLVTENLRDKGLQVVSIYFEFLSVETCLQNI